VSKNGRRGFLISTIHSGRQQLYFFYRFIQFPIQRLWFVSLTVQQRNKSHFLQLPRRNRTVLESSWNVMAHGDVREGKWRGNWWMEWVTSTLHTTSEHGVSSITIADPHTSVASSRLNWRPRRFKWTRPFRRKTKSGFCACAIAFQTQSTTLTPGRWRNASKRVWKHTAQWPVSWSI
jgi:hypothetical protein